MKGSTWHDPDDDTYVVPTSSQRRAKARKIGGDETNMLSGSAYQDHLREVHNSIQNPAVISWVFKAKKRKKNALLKITQEDAEEEYINKETGQELTLSTAAATQENTILKAGNIEITRLPDLLPKAKSTIRALRFHTFLPLALTAGYDKTLRIHEVKSGKLRSSVHLENFPVEDAAFTSHGTQITAIGPCKSIVEYDLASGHVELIKGVNGRRFDRKYTALTVGHIDQREVVAMAAVGTGTILVCDSMTKQLIRSVKMNGIATSVAFHSNEPILVTADRDGFVYEWDLVTGRCMNSMQDHSLLSVSALATGHETIAAGSRTGYVNLYSLESRSLLENPIRSYKNLTTAATAIKYHPSRSLLCIASKWKRNALRLIHLPSKSVFDNWPTYKTPLLSPTAVDFSGCGKYLGIGNETGQTLLYQLDYFANMQPSS